MRTSRNYEGPGITAAAVLTGAASGILVLVSLQIGQIVDLPRWIYLTPILIGYAGFLLGFFICAVGVVITWASIGHNKVNLSWLYPIAARVRRFPSAVFFKMAALCTLMTAILTVVGLLGFDAALKLGGLFGLGVASFTYVGALAVLWKFVAGQVSGR